MLFLVSFASSLFLLTITPPPPPAPTSHLFRTFFAAIILSASTVVISSTINVHALVLQSALAEVQLPAGFTHSTDMNHFQQLFAVVPCTEHQNAEFHCDSVIYILCLHQHCMLFLVCNTFLY